MEMVLDVCLDALVDSAKMLPLLFVVYVLIEWFELKWGNRLGKFMARTGTTGPVLGAAAGIIPQCGISVIASALYSQRLITIGTLFAVFLATSDEAIPVILSQPDRIGVLVPLLVSKFVLAVVLGYLIDLVFRKRNVLVLAHIDDYRIGHDDQEHHHESAFEEKGCCGHAPGTDDHHDESLAKRLLVHPLIHTLKIFLFIFAISLVLGFLFAWVGEDRIASALGSVTFLQPLVCSLVGLIPNCAASVAIAQLYLSGVITFGACLAGLCSSAGIGLLVLIKEGDKKEAWAIIAGLLVLSVVIGTVCQLLGF